MSRYEQNALLRQPNPKASTGLRNLCILILMLRAGLRSGEIISLKTEEIDWVRQKIYLPESGGAGSRVLLLGPDELDLLSEWRDKKPADTPYYVCTLNGQPLKDRYVREMVKRLAFKAGIKKDVYPHLLRHTFAADLYQETGDLRLVQKALGHRDISATQIYSDLNAAVRVQASDDFKRYRRSGMPESVFNDEDEGGRQMQFSMAGTDNLKQSGETVAQNVAAQEIYASNAAAHVSGADHKSAGAYRAAAQAESAAEAAEERKPDPEPAGQLNEGVNEQAITIESESVKIPAIKCSKCSYILRYQIDCPQCGEPFKAILSHWGRKV